jgi:hypothetical protein
LFFLLVSVWLLGGSKKSEIHETENHMYRLELVCCCRATLTGISTAHSLQIFAEDLQAAHNGFTES